MFVLLFDVAYIIGFGSRYPGGEETSSFNTHTFSGEEETERMQTKYFLIVP
jgi:hypothetical protein